MEGSPADCGIGLLKKAPGHFFFQMAPNGLELGCLSLKRPGKAGERPLCRPRPGLVAALVQSSTAGFQRIDLGTEVR